MVQATKDDNDTELNRGQTINDEKFNDISRRTEVDDLEDAYNAPSADETARNLGDQERNASGPTDQDKSVNDLESSPDSPQPQNSSNQNGYKNNYTGDNKSGGNKFLNQFKRKGPMGALIAIFFGGALGIGGLFGGPSLLLINVSEVLQGKFDTAITSLDNRANKIIAVKVKGTTSGLCSNVVSMLCKYKSLSADEMRGMEKQGITFKNGDTTLDPDDIVKGKVRPTHMTFNGSDIPPESFASTYASDPTFRSAVQQGIKFNSRYATVGGKIWQKLKKALTISKQDPFKNEKPDATDDERLTIIEGETKNGMSDTETSTVPTTEESDPRCSNSPCSEQDIKNIEEANSNASEISDAAKNPSSSAEVAQEADALAGDAGGVASIAAKVSSIFKVTGALDDACSVYHTIQGIGYAAKIVRYSQLARYAMVFLTTADMIKAGDAKPDDVNYLSNTLTKTTTSVIDGKQVTTQAATDTLAYRNAAFGDTGTLDTVASSYLTAAGLTGTLIGVTNTVNSILGGNAKSTCKTLSNPFVSAGSLLAGIGLMLVPGGQAIEVGKLAAQAGVGALLMAADMVLPSLLQNIVAGTVVDKNTYGAAAGDALVSGTGALYSSDAQYSGNAPLTPDQAVAYNEAQNQTLAQYAAQDQLAYSPFDVTNQNTFAGMIVTQLSRYAGGFSSILGSVGSVLSIGLNSFSTILSPFTHAASNTAAQYDTCQDEDYQTLGIATDLFCNPVRGIPPQYLNAAPDPDVLFQQMQNSGDADADGNPVSGSAYEKIYDQCINRDQSTSPLGDAQGDDGSGANCIINDQTTANYYIFYIDQNALDQMTNGMTQTGEAS